MSFIPGVVYDRTSSSESQFGDVVQDIPKTAFKRGETVTATFIGANPRNNLRLEQTYAAVEIRRPGDEGRWTRVRDDSDWALVFRWRRVSGIGGTSEVAVEWEVEEWAEPGEYRLRYFGDAKALWDKPVAFEGTSGVFVVE